MKGILWFINKVENYKVCLKISLQVICEIIDKLLITSHNKLV